MGKRADKLKKELSVLITKYNNSKSSKNKLLLYAQITAIDKKLEGMKKCQINIGKLKIQRVYLNIKVN